MATPLRKYLQSLTPDELMNEVLKLSKKFKDVKAYYDMELGDAAQQAELVAACKAKIKKYYFPARGYGEPKAADVRKCISEFKKISVFPFDVIDVLLYRVELAVAFTNTYGDIDETFYTSTEKAFEEALKLMNVNTLTDQFESRCRRIQRDADGIGWGFSDQIHRLAETYLNK